MKTFDNFHSYLSQIINAESEEEKIKLKNEFDIFFNQLGSQQKEEFTNFQLTDEEVSQIEMLNIENEEFEDYLFVKILSDTEDEETFSFDEFKRIIN